MNEHDPLDCLSDSQEDEILQVLGKIVAGSYPNSDRADCPSEEVLQAIAIRKLDPVKAAGSIAHVVRCSPCFRRVQALSKARSRRRALGGAGVAVIALVSGWAWRRPAKQFTVMIDLRKAPIMRGSQPDTVIVAELPRGIVTLTLVLPIGSLPGTYHLALTRDGKLVGKDASGTSQRRAGVDSASFQLDTTNANSGIHQLMVRHESVFWTAYMVAVR